MSSVRHRPALLAAALLATAGAHAGTLLSEGFDDAGSLAGAGGGWSTPIRIRLRWSHRFSGSSPIPTF